MHSGFLIPAMLLFMVSSGMHGFQDSPAPRSPPLLLLLPRPSLVRNIRTPTLPVKPGSEIDPDRGLSRTNDIQDASTNDNCREQDGVMTCQSDDNVYDVVRLDARSTNVKRLWSGFKGYLKTMKRMALDGDHCLRICHHCGQGLPFHVSVLCSHQCSTLEREFMACLVYWNVKNDK